MQNTPVKHSGFVQGNYKGSGLYSNYYNITSPFKPINHDPYDIENLQENNNLYSQICIQSSPIFGARYDLLGHEDESTKHYSNQTYANGKEMHPPMPHLGVLGNISPINYMNNSQQSHESEFQTPNQRMFGKQSPAGAIPSLSHVLGQK